MADKEVKTYRVKNRFRDGVASEEKGRPVYQDKGALLKLDEARAGRLADRNLIEREPLTAEQVKEAEAAAKAARDAAAAQAAAEGGESDTEVAPRESTGAAGGDATTATGGEKKARR